MNPILGCEVYVAPGDRRTKSGTPGETANHLVLLAETKEGYHNLIKLVSSGYTEGFYYKPRIDKELLAQHSKGLIGLSSCLKGEVATGIRHRAAAEGARRGGRVSRHPRARATSSSRCSTRASTSSRSSTSGLQPIAKDLGLQLVATNDVHYLQNSDFKPHDILLCIGTGKTVNDVDRLSYHGDQFYLKTADEMAQVFGDFPEAMRQHRPHRRALQRRPLGHGQPSPELRRSGRLHASTTTSSTSSARVSRCGCRGCRSSQPAAS